MTESEEIKKLEQIKYSLREKEKIILNSQIKQNKIEKHLKKLEKRRNNIIKHNKNLLLKIISFIVYDVIMLSIMISYATFVINNIMLKLALIISIYTGIISISTVGAYLSSLLEEKIKKYYNKHKLNTISNQIKEIETKINLEKEKQEIIKREITEIINRLDNITPKIPLSDFNHIDNHIYENNCINSKVRSKKKLKY